MPNLTERALYYLARPIKYTRVRTMPDSSPAKGAKYLDGEDVIDTLNEIFGYGEWSFELVGHPWQAEPNPAKAGDEVWCAIGKLSIGTSVQMGVGTCQRSGAGAAALEMTIKGATTDALKRAAVHHGDQFGLGLRSKPSDQSLRDDWNKWVETEKARRANAQGEGAQSAQPETVVNPVASASPDRSPAPPVESGEPEGQGPRGGLTLAEVEAEFRAAKRSSSLAGAWLSRSDMPKALTQDLLDNWCKRNPEGTAFDLVYESMVWMSTDAANPSLATACREWLAERKENAA